MHLPLPFLKQLRRILQKRQLPKPTRIRHALRPVFVSLEPRFVLNATAELNEIGQLIIRGDALADLVQLDVNNADQLQLRDGNGAIIPIIGHPGSNTDPLDRSAITSGQLIIDLGGGDDVLDLEIPSGLNVSVLDSTGIDTTTLSFQSSAAIVTNRTIDVATEQITIESSTGAIDLRGTNARFFGDAIIGAGAISTTVQLDDALLEIDGSLNLAGDVNLTGIGAKIDLSAATLSALSQGNDLRISLANTPGNDVLLGDTNDSAGSFVNNVIVDSASSLDVKAVPFEIGGRFDVTGIQQTVRIDTDVVAGSVLVNAVGNVSTIGSITALIGNIEITSNSTIDLKSPLDTSSHSNGNIVIDGGRVQCLNAELLTSGGRVTVSGPTFVTGELQIDTSFGSRIAFGGDIVINGTIDPVRSNLATLSFDARGANGNGVITLAGAVGGLSPLDGITLRASLVQIDSVTLRRGDIVIDAIGTKVTGASITTIDDIEITGALTLPVGNLQITGNNVAIRGVASGQAASQSLDVSATGSVVFANSIVDFANLTVTSQGQVTLNGLVSLAGNLVINSPVPTTITSSSIQTGGSQNYVDGVHLLSSGLINASQVDFGVTTLVAAGVNFTVNAPVAGGSLDKNGDGRLILTSTNLYSGETLLRQGILQIDGETAAAAGPFRITSGRLEGSGRIRSDIITTAPTGNAPSPAIAPGPGIDRLTVGGLNLVTSATVEFQIRGTVPGSEYDQLVVGSQGLAGTIQLGSSQLTLIFDTPAQPATEYVLVRNDGTSTVTGAFSTMLSTTGTTLTSPRVLLEGSFISEDFGGSGRPAYITYAGGDGNDVAIVTAGDVTFRPDNVTLIQRNGSNLEIRTGSDLPTAQTATPTIRPIATINDYQVNILGSQADQALFVDLNGFRGPAPGAIQYTGDIVFNGGGSADNDTITLFDLNTKTDDSPASVRYSLDGANAGDIHVVIGGNASQFDIRFAQTESIQQRVLAPRVDFQYSSLDEQITLTADLASPERTDFTSTTNGGRLSISIENPTSQLAVNAGGGNDSITVAGFGSGSNGFAAALDIDGEAGADTVVVQADLSLGRAGVTGNATVSAESITINGDIDTTGGTMDGQVNLIGGASISVSQAANIDAGYASILVDANGGTFNSVRGALVSGSSSDAVVIENASRVQLGNVNAEIGRFRIETNALAGNITQAVGTRVIVDRLSIDSLGIVAFSNRGNEVAIVERIDAGDEVALSDSAGNLAVALIDSQGHDVTLTTTGNLSLAAGAIVAVGATVNASAGLAILDSRSPGGTTVANVTTGTLNASAGVGGIGTSTKPLVVAISESVNANTVGAGSNIFLSSPLVSMPVGLIDAGTGKVTMTSVSIQDDTDDNAVDIVASELRMTAQNGIGSVRKLALQNVTDLSATTDSGGIRLDNASNTNPTIRLLKATSGPIEIQNTFSPEIIIQRIESGNGNVTVTNQDGSIVVRGDGVNADSIVAGAGGAISLTAAGNDSDITLMDSIRATTDNVVLTADGNVFAMKDGDIQTSGGFVFLTADARLGAFGGKIEMSDGAVIDAITGLVRLVADGDVTLGSVRSQNSAGNAIVIESTSGAVKDGGDADLDIVSNSGGAMITGFYGIGSTNAIETSLAVIVADTRGVGDLQVMESDAIDLRSVRSTDGSIAVVAGGTIIATKVISLNPNSIDNSTVPSASHRDVSLRANGVASDILVGQITALNVTDVLLVAGDDVIDTNPVDSNLIVADDLTIDAANGTSDGTDAVNLTTTVNDIVLSVTGINVGDVSINEVDAVELRSVTTADGSIKVLAGGTITATKVISLNPNRIDNSTVPSDPHRDINLRANGLTSDILVGQITAMNVTDVLLVAGDDVVNMNPANLSLIMADDLTVDVANGTSDGPIAVNLTTDVKHLLLAVTGIKVGDVSINEVDAIELRSVSTADGSIAVVAGGTITATKVISLNPNSIDNSTVPNASHRDVSLRANGLASDILVGQITAMNVTDVLLVAGDDVIDTNSADSSLIMADDLTVDVANGTSDGPIAVNLTTDVKHLLLAVTGINVGDVSINEVDAIELRSVSTADGSIAVAAGGTITATKVISLNPNSIDNSTVPSASHRDVSLRANGLASDILVGQITAMNVTDVLLVAGDDVIDTNSADSSLIMADDLTVDAANGTNDGTDAVKLTTNVNDLVLSVTGINVGDVSINEVDAIELRSVSTSDGSITVVGGGTVTATKVISLNPNSIDNSTVASAPHRDISLRANGLASDILVGQITALNVTDVLLVAGDDVVNTTPADSNLIMADDLKVDAANGTSDGTDAVKLTTNVNDLVLSVTGTNVGDVSINEVDAVELRSVTTAKGSIAVVASGTITSMEVTASSPSNDSPSPSRDIYLETKGSQSDVIVGTLGGDFGFLLTENGKISVVAGRNIIVSDSDAGNDGPKLRQDVEINARGSHGQILLKAEQKIELGGATQLEASINSMELKESLALKQRIVVEGRSVVLGSQIQLLTHDAKNPEAKIGVARWFSPRPATGVPDTAFFDSTTVRRFPDNRLSGDGNSGGIGTFSVLIGQPGEVGFTIDIDWGAETKRFEQFGEIPDDKVSRETKVLFSEKTILGGQTFVTTHVYNEDDILDKRDLKLNGRPSATDPLQVRFAVRHHESIVVTGDTIQQGNSPVESAPGPGRLISSTDNPSTALLESGTATFFIPNLTIPVAFFPVRQIIPEVVKPEIFVRVETSQFFASSTVESKTASASATVSRDEHFQIRILSLEPGGEDLAPPQRLPDDILAGDNLKRLFAELPDGKYEIQYVLGDGNERTLLRVDIRNQQPVVPGDELDGGKLELQPIDPESILLELQEATSEYETDKEPIEAQMQSIGASPIAGLASATSPVVARDEESEHDQHAAYALTAVIVASNVRKRSLRNVGVNRPRRFSIAGRFVNRQVG